MKQYHGGHRTLSEGTLLASYVPGFVARRFAANPTLLAAPEAERFPAAVLFAEVAGFTPLAERMARQGHAGMEELTCTLNAYFGRLVDQILNSGGDVIKFAGGMVLALWPAKTGVFTLEEAIHQAAQCSLTMQMVLHSYARSQDVHLRVRIGIGSGEVMAACVGGRLGRWAFVVGGAPLAQAGLASSQARPGEVVLSPEAGRLAQAWARGEQLQGGGLRLNEATFFPLPGWAGFPVLTPAARSALRAFIPGAILSRLDAGQADWLAEMRRVTMVFLNVTGIEYAAPDALDRLQTMMCALQAALYRYEGNVNQLFVDDKGLNLAATFGLLPLSHQDDAVRAVQASLDMRARLSDLNLHGAIGITSGSAFCGVWGNQRRREYALIGDAADISACLTQATRQAGLASAGISILCDQATRQAAHNQIDFETLPPIAAKGKAVPFTVYCPLSRKTGSTRLVAALVGREPEPSLIAEILEGREVLGDFGYARAALEN